MPLKMLSSIALGALCIVGSFAIGMGSSSNVQTVTTSEAAEETFVAGDVSGNGTLDVQDAITILEIATERRSPTATERKRADVNGDLLVTEEDALRVLRSLAIQ